MLIIREIYKIESILHLNKKREIERIYGLIQYLV